MLIYKAFVGIFSSLCGLVGLAIPVTFFIALARHIKQRHQGIKSPWWKFVWRFWVFLYIGMLGFAGFMQDVLIDQTIGAEMIGLIFALIGFGCAWANARYVILGSKKTGHELLV